jgi:predicted nucleic acid-binding Zn ribbon protein
VERERCFLADRAPESKAEVASLADRIPELLARRGLAPELWQQELERDWAGIVGPAVAQHARPGRYAGRRLTVFVDNAPWLDQLKRFSQKELLAKLQQRFGADRIATLSLQPDPDPPGDMRRGAGE